MVYKYFFKTLLSILWGIYWDVELWYHTVILFSIVWGNTILFSITAALFYIPTKSVQYEGSNSPHPCQHLLFLMTVTIMGGKWYCIVVLIYISQNISDVEHLFMCFSAICISSLKKYLLKYFAHSLIGLFCCWDIKVLYTFWILILYIYLDMWFANIFSYYVFAVLLCW